MTFPFTVEQFFSLFETYNAAIWPAQVVAYVLGLITLASLWLGGLLGKRIVLFTLAIMWAWNAMAYHFAFFTTINPMAKDFSAGFGLQAVLFAASSVSPNDLRFQLKPDLRSFCGFSCIVYAMLIYELLGHVAGHGLMKGPMFGVTPCSTTIFTIGILLLVQGRLVTWLAIIPIGWSLVGSSAAIFLGVPEDFGLALAAMTLLLALAKERFWNRNSRATLSSDVRGRA